MVREITGSELSWFFEGLVYGDQTLNYTVSAVEEHSATFERQGKLIIPTEVELTFAGGKTFRQTWDGQVTPLVLTFTDKPPIKKATVDPDGKLLVDLCWGDNSLRRTLDLWSWLVVVTRIVFQFQDVLLIGGGL